MKISIRAIIFTLLYLLDKTRTAQLPISINQNGYEGVTIVISNNIEDNVVIVEKIKNWMTEASRVLYKATKYHLYFKHVTIVLPKTWSVQNNYKKIAGSKFNKGHIRIDDENPVVGKVPYVFGQTECGQPGQYMHLTTYLLYAGSFAGFGEIGDVFVHEWGHLRWGLYDEYASFEEASLNSPSAFYLENGTWKPVRCTEEVTGRNVNIYTGAPCSVTSDGVPEKDCVFVADEQSTATASLMGHQNVVKMEEFCDKDDTSTKSNVRHNIRAPNNQNIRCNYRSAWEVMREHTDFKGNTPGSVTKDTTPQFTVEIETDQRICLSLDISGSMAAKDRISKMYAAVSNFILNNVEDGTSVGIVTFSGKGNILHPMLTISSQSDRDKLVSSLSSSAGGGTSIGAGILSCITALNSSSDGLEGSMIYLLTDGKEVSSPYISDVQSIVTDSGITVNTLALGNKADMQLGDISRASGGKSFYYSEEDNSTVLIDAFASTVVDNSKDSYTQIDSTSFKISSSQSFQRSIIIDESIGRETLFQIVTNDTSSVGITVTGPNQVVYTETKSTLGMVTLKIPSIAQTGQYTISVTTTTNSPVSSILNIQSKARTAGQSVITANAWLSDDIHIYGPESRTIVYVSVLKGMSPVINTDVFVNIDSYGKFTSLQLHDNGIGSDVRENDGIYSGYILSSAFQGNGRNSVKVTVQNLNNKAKILFSQETSETFPYYSGLTTTSAGNFQRVVLSNEITVTNYSSDPLLDSIKPSKITSLTLKSVQSTNGQIQAILTWKAVGDDLDIGTASQYEVRMSDNFLNIQQQPDQATEITLNVPVPKLAGILEQLIINFYDQFKTRFIVVRAIDDSGNRGDYSNIVSISTLTDQSWMKVSASSLSWLQTILSGSVAFAMLIIIIIFGFCSYSLYSKEQKSKLKKYKQRKRKLQHTSYYDYRRGCVV